MNLSFCYDPRWPQLVCKRRYLDHFTDHRFLLVHIFMKKRVKRLQIWRSSLPVPGLRVNWACEPASLIAPSPVPALSSRRPLPAPYRGWTRLIPGGRKKSPQESRKTCMRILGTLPFFPQIGEKPYMEVFSRFGLWPDFLNDNMQATISAFRSID